MAQDDEARVRLLGVPCLRLAGQQPATSPNQRAAPWLPILRRYDNRQHVPALALVLHVGISIMSARLLFPRSYDASGEAETSDFTDFLHEAWLS